MRLEASPRSSTREAPRDGCALRRMKGPPLLPSPPPPSPPPSPPLPSPQEGPSVPASRAACDGSTARLRDEVSSLTVKVRTLEQSVDVRWEGGPNNGGRTGHAEFAASGRAEGSAPPPCTPSPARPLPADTAGRAAPTFGGARAAAVPPAVRPAQLGGAQLGGAQLGGAQLGGALCGCAAPAASCAPQPQPPLDDEAIGAAAARPRGGVGWPLQPTAQLQQAWATSERPPTASTPVPWSPRGAAPEAADWRTPAAQLRLTRIGDSSTASTHPLATAAQPVGARPNALLAAAAAAADDALAAARGRSTTVRMQAPTPATHAAAQRSVAHALSSNPFADARVDTPVAPLALSYTPQMSLGACERMPLSHPRPAPLAPPY